MKVWIAQREIDYEGDTFLGAFSSKELALKKCETKEGKPLTFKKVPHYNTYNCRLGGKSSRTSWYGYVVFETEVDRDDASD